MNRYERKNRSDLESTSRPHRVEVKLRPCIHEIYLTIFVQTLILFCKYFGIENDYNVVIFKGGKWTKWACNAIFNETCVLKTK